jgi:hypothetical protein
MRRDPAGHDRPAVAGAARVRRRAVVLVLMLALTALGLPGCYYVVPVPPPPPGAAPAVPPQVRERPQCGWMYGPGWRGWAWYSSVPC